MSNQYDIKSFLKYVESNPLSDDELRRVVENALEQSARESRELERKSRVPYWMLNIPMTD